MELYNCWLGVAFSSLWSIYFASNLLVRCQVKFISLLVSFRSRLGCQVIVSKEMENWEITVPGGVADARDV